MTTKEVSLKIGRNDITVGLDFDFGFLLILERFGASLSDFDKLKNAESDEIFAFLIKIIKATHTFYCEQNDEPIQLNNDSKIAKVISHIGMEELMEWIGETMHSFAPATAPAETTTTEEKKA